MWNVSLGYFRNTCLKGLREITKSKKWVYTLTHASPRCDAQPHHVKSQKTLIFSNTAVRTSNLARSRNATRDWVGSFDVPQLKEIYIKMWFTSGHGKFRSYIRRFHIKVENRYECTCGSKQTVEHLLFDCPIFGNRRVCLEIHLNKFNISYHKPLYNIFSRNCCQKHLINFIHHINRKL